MSFVIENNIIKGDNLDFDFAKLGGIGNIIFNSLKQFGPNIAQIDPETDRKDTFEDLLRHATRTAIVMRRKGIRRGDIVLGCSDNHMDASTPFTAALFIGAIPCSMDPCLTLLETRHMLSKIAPKMIFTVPSALGRIKNVCQELRLNPELVVFGPSDKYTEFQSFLGKQPDEDKFAPIISQDPMETAVVYSSSGTSGLAKFCCLNHTYFIKETKLVPKDISPENLDVERMEYEWSKVSNGGTFLYYSALYWITGSKIFFESIVCGVTRVLVKKFDVEKFWNMVEKYKVAGCLVAPFHISLLVKRGRPASVRVDSLAKVLTGGCLLQKQHWKGLQDMLPDIDIVQCYGLTETGVITYFESYDKLHREYYKAHPECVGFPRKGIWYKVVDVDTREPLGPNQEGELMIKSNYSMNGYYNQPFEESFDGDGWFLTGDMVYYKENGAFYFIDRAKELMKYRQLTVYPYVIENELMKHPAVSQAVVVGIPHAEDGDRPAAFVVLHSDYEEVTAEQLRKIVDAKMLDRAKLRGEVRIIKSLPITSTNKVKRRELRKMILEEMQQV